MSNVNLLPVGIKIPIQRGANGFFEQSFNTLEQASVNIKNVLLTMHGERRMNTKFGSLLHNLLFEQMTENDDVIFDTLADTIASSINTYVPYVVIKDIKFNVPKFANNQIVVNIVFALKNSSNTSFGGEEGTVSMAVNV